MACAFFCDQLMLLCWWHVVYVAVVLLEGGTEFDLKALDQAAVEGRQMKGLVCWLFLLQYDFTLVLTVAWC